MKNQSMTMRSFVQPTADESASLILDNHPEAVILADCALTINYYNQKAKEEVWRFRNVRLKLGMPLLDLVQLEEKTTIKQLLSDVLNGDERKLEHKTVQPNGTEEYYASSFTPARNSDAQTVGILLRWMNITEKKKIDKHFQEAEERWQFAFEASNQAAWDWNMQTNEVIYSSSYKKMYGFSGNELSNDVSEWQNRIHPDDKSRIEEAIEEHTKSNNPYYETTYRIQLKNGQYKWIMARGKLVEKDGAGRPLRMIGTHTDLTETLQRKATFKKMNERFHYAAKASSQALWEWNAQTGEAYVSPSFTEMFGWEADENRRFEQWHQFVHPDDYKATVDGYYHTLNQTTDSIWQATYRFLKSDGTYAVVSDKAYIIRNHQKKVLKVIGATHDVTALKKAEDELFHSNERFAIMMKATHDQLWDWNLETDRVYRWPKELINVYGLADDEAINTNSLWMERIHPADRKKVNGMLKEFDQAHHHQTFELEYRFKKDDGAYTHIYDRGILLKNEVGKPVRMIGAAQNIAERKRLEAELLKSELETKKRINQATVDSQEQERNEIGRELHDNINQMLTTTKLYLELIRTTPDLADELLEKSADNIGRVINEIRQLSRSLMDPIIGDLGIVDAINDLVENINLTRKINVSLQVDEAIESLLNKNQKLTIFRIIQESLNNIIRHANATFVTIGVCKQDTQVKLEIIDDGVGFCYESVKKGAGLKNITNRVYLINGNLAIDSSPGKGCVIRIYFPIN